MFRFRAVLLPARKRNIESTVQQIDCGEVNEAISLLI